MINTHLGLRAGDRLQQVSTLLGDDWIGSAAFRALPAIICGDLSAVGSSSAYRRMAQHFQDAQLLAGSSTESVRREIVSLMPALGAFARTFYRNAADADDMVQEKLVRALIHLDRYEEGTRLKSWLFTIMRNTFCTRNRVTRREAVGTLECVSSRESVQRDQEWRVRGHELEAACMRLPEKYRGAFEFVFLDAATTKLRIIFSALSAPLKAASTGHAST